MRCATLSVLCNSTWRTIRERGRWSAGRHVLAVFRHRQFPAGKGGLPVFQDDHLPAPHQRRRAPASWYPPAQAVARSVSVVARAGAAVCATASRAGPGSRGWSWRPGRPIAPGRPDRISPRSACRGRRTSWCCAWGRTASANAPSGATSHAAGRDRQSQAGGGVRPVHAHVQSRRHLDRGNVQRGIASRGFDQGRYVCDAGNSWFTEVLLHWFHVQLPAALEETGPDNTRSLDCWIARTRPDRDSGTDLPVRFRDRRDAQAALADLFRQHFGLRVSVSRRKRWPLRSVGRILSRSIPTSGPLASDVTRSTWTGLPRNGAGPQASARPRSSLRGS